MRYNNKIYCCRCGKFLFNLNDEEMKKIEEDRLIGARTNCEYFCGGGCKR